MKTVRAFLALLLAAATTAMIVRVAIPRLECNLAKGHINRDVRLFQSMGDEFARTTKARRNVVTCRHCLAMFPQDHHWYVLMAANLRILNEQEEAIRAFERALTFTERPEIYAQIAELEIERGNIEAARVALLKAATFQLFYIDYVSDPLRGEVQAAVMARYERIQAKAQKRSGRASQCEHLRPEAGVSSVCYDPAPLHSQENGIEQSDRIFVAGHRGMVGSALIRALTRAGYTNLITAPRPGVDLRDGNGVRTLFAEIRPDVVILAAAKVGGIQANRLYPADFLYDNLAIQTNVIHESHRTGVRELVFLGSSCIYPRECPQPMKEEYLLTGLLEPTNEAYALAKIAGLRMAQYYQKQHGMRAICPMPSNLYGTNDNFHPENSHVLSALVRKFCDAIGAHAPTVTVWGTGTARREFLHVDDLADAVLLLIDRWQSSDIINVGAGEDVSIRDLAELIADKAGFNGQIVWDASMPDGMPRKLLDISRISALGFKPRIPLERGIEQTIDEYRRKMRSSSP